MFDRLRRPASRRNEGYRSVNPQDNFYQSSAFFPMPFALITTKNEAGVTSIGPYSLVFPLDISEEHSMLLVSRASSNTATNLRRNGKCALHWIEFDKPLLQTVVDLGYPGVPPEEKMRDVPFELMPSPTPQFRDDPDFPLLIKGAFQIFECELDGRFEYHPVRRAPRQLVEDYLALKVKNILMPESFRQKLLERRVFPDMPISYGFRGGKEFWFVRHGEPFHLPVPKGKGMAGLAFERKQPVQTCNLKTDSTGDVRPGAKAVDAQAAVALPVFDGAGEVRAIVGIAWMGERELSETELATLRQAAKALAG